MKKRLFALVLFMLLFSSVAVFADDAIYEVDLEITFGQTEARNMLGMVNSFRTGNESWYYNPDGSKYNCNLSELVYDYALEQVAMYRAAEIALAYGHGRPNGDWCFGAYTDMGYVCNAKAENIAAGYTSAESVFTAWREDYYDYNGQGHRRNMLGSGYRAIGIGHAVYNGVHFWVQEFSDRVNSSEYTQPADSNMLAVLYVNSAFITTADFMAEGTEKLKNMHCGDNLELIMNGVSISVNGYDFYGNSFSTWGGNRVVHPVYMLEESGDHVFCNDEEGNIYVCGTGNTTLYVSALGQYVSYDVTATHNPEKIIGAVAPTCTTDGMTGDIYCSGCDILLSANTVIPATGHKEVVDKAVKATYSSTGLTEGKHCESCGEILVSQKKTDMLQLAKPVISSAANSSNGITIKWGKVTGAKGYYIYRNNKLIATIKNGSTASYIDKSASNGVKYSYKIKAFAGSNISTASKEKLAYRLIAPKLSSVSNTSKSTITVKWNKNTKATGYELRVISNGSIKTYNISKTSTVKKVISSLKKGNTVSVSLRSYKTLSGVKYYSAWSSSKNVKISK